jgi:hypothetical protein
LDRALDPKAGSKAASAAKREAEDLRFEIERVDSALIALRAAQDEAKGGRLRFAYLEQDRGFGSTTPLPALERVHGVRLGREPAQKT